MSVLDLIGKRPRERGEGATGELGEGRGGKKSTSVPTNLPGQGELVGQGRVTQLSGFPDFLTYDCAFLCRERIIFEETESCEHGAHVVPSTGAWTGGKADRVSQLTRLQELDHTRVDQSAVSLKNSS